MSQSSIKIFGGREKIGVSNWLKTDILLHKSKYSMDLFCCCTVHTSSIIHTTYLNSHLVILCIQNEKIRITFSELH